MCFLICSKTLFETFLILRRIQLDIIMCAEVVLKSVRYFCQILMELKFFQHILKKL